MNKDKKIKIQDKIIHELESENKSLTLENQRLKQIVDETKQFRNIVEKYRTEHENNINSLKKAREQYISAYKELVEYKKKYVKDMQELIKVIDKNIWRKECE